jgi:hypothetical protein
VALPNGSTRPLAQTPSGATGQSPAFKKGMRGSWNFNCTDTTWPTMASDPLENDTVVAGSVADSQPASTADRRRRPVLERMVDLGVREGWGDTAKRR